jgi:hypothetical protein
MASGVAGSAADLDRRQLVWLVDRDEAKYLAPADFAVFTQQ